MTIKKSKAVSLRSKNASKKIIQKEAFKKPAEQIKPAYKYMVFLFAALAMVIIGFILYYSLSQATIVITPQYRDQQVDFAVQIIDQENFKTSAENDYKLPGRIIETSAESQKSFPAKTYEVTQDKAFGQVTLINNYSKSQILIATTRLLAPDGRLYRLTQTVTVPAGGSLTAQAVADQAGAEYEITDKTTLTIPGLWEPLQNQIYAETENMIRGKLTKTVIEPVQIEQATAELKNELQTKIQEQLQSQLQTNEKLESESLQLETLKYSSSEPAGSQASEFTINLSLGAKALIYDENKLKEIASNNLPEIYKTNSTYLNINPESFDYKINFLDQNSENLIAQAKGEFTITLTNINLDKTKLIGLKKAEAEIYLKGQGDIKKVEIKLPFWTNRLPQLVDKINIQVKE